MSLHNTPSGERLHIAFFGKRNAGKSSLVNAVTGQELSVVSPVKGTTTDPVRKAMELLPLGPVVIIDTPGFDDEGELGELRVQKTKKILGETDLAVLAVDGSCGISKEDQGLLTLLKEKKIPFLTVYTKKDLGSPSSLAQGEMAVSALTGEGIEALKEALAALGKSGQKQKAIVADLVKAGDTVVLVIPIDASAPKGRLILPQQMVLRELLDCHCTVLCCRDEDLAHTINGLKAMPSLVITDSQVFGKVEKILLPGVPLTSFSILMARYKGELSQLVKGAERLQTLKEGDRVLISEGCSHHRQCADIGTVKIPGWIRSFSQCDPTFSFTSGGEFPDDLSSYALVVHCGGCMLNEAEMKNRMEKCERAGVPMVNYGVAIAHMHGILEKSLYPFKALQISE